MSLRPGRGGQPAEPLLAPAAVSTAPTAAVIAAWFLWVLGTIFALVAMILAAIILSRANSIQDGVDALRSCCANVYSTVVSIWAYVQVLYGQGCIPVYSTSGLPITTPGCYQFMNNIPCAVAGGTCFPVYVDGVTFKLGGYSLIIGDTLSRGFDFIGVSKGKVQDGQIYNTVKSAGANSIAIYATLTNSLAFDDLRINNMFHAFRLLFCNHTVIAKILISNCSSHTSGQSTYALYAPGNQDLTIDASSFVDNNIDGFSSYGLYLRGWDGVSTRGLRITNSYFKDTTFFIHNTAAADAPAGLPNTNGNYFFENNMHDITDPAFDEDFMTFVSAEDPAHPSDALSTIQFHKCNFRTTSAAHPALDGIIFAGVAGVKMEKCVFDMYSNGSASAVGTYMVGAVHIGIGMSALLDGTDFTYMVQNGFTFVDNTFRGGNRLYNVTGAATNQLMNHAFLIESNSQDITIKDNDISGIAANANATCLNSNCSIILPAQNAAAIFVSAGTARIKILRNDVHGASCGNGGTAPIPGDGIVISDAQVVGGLFGPIPSVSFPAPIDVIVQQNNVYGNCGRGIANLAGSTAKLVSNTVGYNTVNILDATASLNTYGGAVTAGGNVVF